MFAMTFTWSLLLSTAVFLVTAWYVRRLLLEQDIQKGFTLNVVVFTVATIASSGAGAVAGWIGNKIEGGKSAVQTSAPTAAGAQSAVNGIVQE
ncbi:MAG: hypothetical protein GJU76_13620 [Gallionella sp.]|jgi:hypothetical protein|nr:hypothetical protein [Gallionella sp.]